jgi:hypothetical protein
MNVSNGPHRFYEKDKMRFIASNIEQFRRGASIIATVLILASIGGGVMSQLLPRNQILGGIAAILYLVLGVAVKIILRASATNSVIAVNAIELIGFIGLALVVPVDIYHAFIDGFEGFSIFRLLVDGIISVIAIFLVRKNTSIARSMALQSER